MQQFQNWSHWFAGAVLSFVTFYAGNKAVQNAVNSAVAGHPKLSVWVLGLTSIVVAYANSRTNGAPVTTPTVRPGPGVSNRGAARLDGIMKVNLIVAVLFFVWLLVCGMFVSGCRHNANMANPRVALTVTLLDASNATVTIADGLTAADHVLDQIQSAEPDYYNHVRPLLTKIAKANDAANEAIQAARNGNPSNWQGALANVAAVASTSDLTVFGFKNNTMRQYVQDGFAVLVSGLTLAAQFGAQHQ